MKRVLSTIILLGVAILVADFGFGVRAANLLNLATEVKGILAAVNGGTGLSSPGASGNILTSTGSAWASSTPSGAGLGTVSSVSAGTGMSFTTITSSGSVSMSAAQMTRNFII